MEPDQAGAAPGTGPREQASGTAALDRPSGTGPLDRPLVRRSVSAGLLGLVVLGAVRVTGARTATDGGGAAGNAAAPPPRARPVPAAEVPSGPRTPTASAASPSPTVATASPTPTAAPASPSPAGSFLGSPGAPSQGSPGRAELPRGGHALFPEHRLVGFSGGPGTAAFGRLGIGDLDDRVREIEQWGRRYARGRTPLPVLELIAVVVQSVPGRDGRYRSRVGPDVIEAHLAAARRHRGLLLLNVQPGRARFLDEVRALERWLREPDVGLALDPEWAVGPAQVPGEVFGRTTGAEIDRVCAYVDGIVRERELPQKAVVVHQLTPTVVTGWKAVRRRPGVAVIASVDGIGPPGAKVATWRRVVAGLPAHVHRGFKLFFEEDARGSSRLMTPAEVLALRPRPEYVLYE